MTSRIIFVTVADDRYNRKGGNYGLIQDSVKQFLLRNPILGITDYLFLKWEDIIKTQFYIDNKNMLDNPDPSINGRCYKPYAILEALQIIDDGDYLIYNDVSPELWNNYIHNNNINDNYDINIIKQLCCNNNGILTAAVITYPDSDAPYGYHTHEHYTLECCINRMGLQEYKYSLQHASGMIVLQKSNKTVEFVNEWYKYNIIDECASLESIPPNKNCNFWGDETELYGKMGHRHDQSISGLLINKLNNKLVIPINGYNFLSFCMKNINYDFVDSNYNYKNLTKYYYKMIFNGIKWNQHKLLRYQ
jgi:hypothetical protein